MSKFIDRIIWNKDPSKQYDISTTADKVFIDQENHMTVLDFFSWVKNFFEEGVFIAWSAKEPQSYQTKIWFDISTYEVPIETMNFYLVAESTATEVPIEDVSYDGETGSILIDTPSLDAASVEYISYGEYHEGMQPAVEKYALFNVTGETSIEILPKIVYDTSSTSYESVIFGQQDQFYIYL